MKVFLSWSGAPSRAIALAFANWIPKVIQGIQPFVSAKDIDKGSNWTVELTRELVDSSFGIICLTPDNLLSPWLNYEAGAISKSVDSRVCPILHGVTKEQVQAPMAQLQMTAIELDDVKLLMASMNRAAGSPLSPDQLNESVEVWWPYLRERISEIDTPRTEELPQGAKEPAKPQSSVEEMVTEVLHRVRDLDRRLGRVERASARDERMKRPVAASGTSRVMDDLFRVTRNANLPVSRLANGEGFIEMLVADSLPDVIPDTVYSEFCEIAEETQQEIRLKGKDRTVTWSARGTCSEPPF